MQKLENGSRLTVLSLMKYDICINMLVYIS